jgi:hypothetical protein
MTTEITRQQPQFSSKMNVDVFTIPKVNTRTRQGSSLSSSTIQTPKMNIDTGVKIDVGTATGLANPTRSSNRPASFNFNPNIPRETGVPFGVGFPKFSFDESFGLKSRTGGKKRMKYTPDFLSLITNRKGKAPRGLETGARARPITPGFKWSYSEGKSGGFKMPKMRMPKF